MALDMIIGAPGGAICRSETGMRLSLWNAEKITLESTQSG